MDHEQSKQMAAQAKIQKGMMDKELAERHKARKFEVLQVAIATADKIGGGGADTHEEAAKSVMAIADMYMKWLD